VALVRCRTHNRVATGAHTCLAGIGLCTRIAVITGTSIGLVWIRANPRAGVAHPGGVTLIERGADFGRARCADSGLTAVSD